MEWIRLGGRTLTVAKMRYNCKLSCRILISICRRKLSSQLIPEQVSIKSRLRLSLTTSSLKDLLITFSQKGCMLKEAFKKVALDSKGWTSNKLPREVKLAVLARRDRVLHNSSKQRKLSRERILLISKLAFISRIYPKLHSQLSKSLIKLHIPQRRSKKHWLVAK